MMFHMRKRVVGWLFALVFLASGTAFGAQPCLSVAKVSYNGPEESRYLQAGVSQMVETRLKDAGVIVSDACKDGDLAISVTLFGGTANLGANLDKAGYHFSRSGSEGELLSFVQLLADEVAAVVTGGVTPAPAPAPVKKDVGPAPVPAPVQEGDALRSDVFPLKVQSVAVGDFNGDGVKEGVALSQGLLQFISLSKDGISEKSRIALPDYMKPVRLNVLDFDQDGKAELLVSALHSANQTPLSVVYRHNGTTLVQVGKEARFLTAVVNLPGEEGAGCIGQRLDGIDYWGDLHRVTLGEKGLELGKALDLDASFKVLGWDNAPVQAGDKTGFFKLSESGHLSFWSDAKASTFTSDENYGGSLLFLSKVEGSKEREKRRYLVSRVQAVDTDKLKGVGVLQSENAMGTFFQGLRRYKNGRVVVVAWNGYELAPVAATPTFKGFMSDFSVVDVDGDGELEAFCSVVNKKGGLSGKSRTYFVLSPLK